MPLHCSNSGPHVKGVDFDQYYSPVISYPILHLVVSISDAYHINIVVTDVTNAFHNTLKFSTKYYIINFPPNASHGSNLFLQHMH